MQRYRHGLRLREEGHVALGVIVRERCKSLLRWLTALAYVLPLTFLFQEACATPTFGPRTDFPTAHYPNDLATGDLNGDGRLDLVAACYLADSICVLLGNGDGTFQPRHDLPTGSGPIAVTLADVNRDGRLDILVVEEYASTFSVLPGNGDGTFAPRLPIGGPFALPVAIAVGDLNGDSKLDVVLAHLANHGFSSFLGNGDGTFNTPVYHPDANPKSISLGDVNADGRLDVLEANTAGGVSIFPGNGDGTLNSPTFLAGIATYEIALSDFNQDGKADLAVADDGSGVSVWLSTGDGSFGPRSDYGTSGSAVSLVVSDLDKDGFLDVAAGNSSTFNISVLAGKGDGTFAPKVDFTTTYGNHGVVVGDFNGDQLPDLAGAEYGADVISVLMNTTIVDTPPARSQVAFLAQNRPNPARGPTTIWFSIEAAADVRLAVYDVSGHLVSTLVRGPLSAGSHSAVWDRWTERGVRAAAGVYVYELRTNQVRFTQRMTLLGE